MKNLLFSLADLKIFHPVESIGDMLFDAAFGFAFVIVGITVLILIFTAFGALMKRLGTRKAGKIEERETSAASEPVQLSGVSPEVVAVITAAIAAYYEGEAQKCDFVVRRIKKL